MGCVLVLLLSLLLLFPSPNFRARTHRTGSKKLVYVVDLIRSRGRSERDTVNNNLCVMSVNTDDVSTSTWPWMPGCWSDMRHDTLFVKPGANTATAAVVQSSTAVPGTSDVPPGSFLLVHRHSVGTIAAPAHLPFAWYVRTWYYTVLVPGMQEYDIEPIQRVQCEENNNY